MNTQATLSPQRYAALAYRWAELRWSLMDRSVVSEWIKRARACSPNPETMIDYYAEKYGLSDPLDGPNDKEPKRRCPPAVAAAEHERQRAEAAEDRIGANVRGRVDEFLRLVRAGDDAAARGELLALLKFFPARRARREKP